MTDTKSGSEKINSEEVVYYGYNFDEYGKVFEWNGKICRGIYPHKSQELREVLNSGLIDELISKDLFPETKITDLQLEGFEIILEHERISPVLYPSNWSFDMFKAAALCILDVNIVARKYGYQTVDAHGFNVVFDHCKPKFVDLGSFIKVNENPDSWRAYEEFKKYFYYPLRVFSQNNLFLGRAIIGNGKNHMPHSSYYQFKDPILRLFNSSFIDKALGSYFKFRHFTTYSLPEIEQRSPGKIAPLLTFLKKKNLAPLQSVNLKRWRRKIDKIKLPKNQTQWGAYHDQFLGEGGRIKSTPRFDRIIEIIKDLQPENIIEVGGNQGMFSELVLQETPVKSILCTDYDELAVNKMFNRLKGSDISITPAVLNIVAPTIVEYGPDLYERLKADMLIALAITHHLILTQKIPVETIFKQFNKLSEGYVITEFMPLGLYSPASKRNQDPPVWYTEEWFKRAFENEYHLLYHEKLEDNRILFVGEKREHVE